MQFSVASAEDNGVGDDLSSFSFDGKRSLKWNQKEQIYGRNWKLNDVVGCEQRVSNDSKELIFYLNGESLGSAFTVNKSKSLLSPAVSLDTGESIVLNLGQKPFVHHIADETSKRVTIPVKDVLIHTLDDFASRNAPIPSKEAVAEESSSSHAVEEKDFSPLDLENDVRFLGSREEALYALEALGLHYLKAELTRRGLKAGGTLEERAARLLSVKGLPADQIDGKLKASTTKTSKV